MNVYIPYTSYDYTKMQGPAPSGFHVPLIMEWQGLKTIMGGLGLTTGNNWKINLHMPFAGSRKYSTAGLINQGSDGNYWSSSSYSAGPDKARSLYLDSSYVRATSYRRAYGFSVRCFKDSYETPTSSWTVVQGTLGSAGIFWNQSQGLISITDGTTGYTMMDKNLGATIVYSDGDTLSEANMGNMYQWGNNYGFPSTGSVTTSSTQVNAGNYGPGNYYTGSTFITRSSSPYDWSSVQNDNLWGGVTGVSPMSEVKNAYIGEYKGWTPGKNTLAYYPLTSTSTVNDLSGNGINLTNNGNVTFGTNYGVDCAKFSGNGVLRNSVLTTQYIGQTFTISEWVLRHGNELVIGTCNNSGTKRAILTNLSTTFVNYPIGTGSSYSNFQYSINTVTDQWYHIVMTHDSTGALVGYLNGQQIITGNITVGEGASNFGIGASVFKDSEIYYSNGAASNIIIENKVWTANDISDYYNQTKSNYGL